MPIYFGPPTGHSRLLGLRFTSSKLVCHIPFRCDAEPPFADGITAF